MKRIILTFLMVPILVFQPFNALTQQVTIPKIMLTTYDGKEIPLEDEDLSGIKKRPLAKTKERLDKKYYEGFFLLYRIKVPEGTHVKGEYTLVRGPLRITIFEITKQYNAVRKVRVVASGFYHIGNNVEFDTIIKKLEENIFLITAEAVESEMQLNPALEYINKIENEVILKGYSSNLSLSMIKFNISGKDEMRRPVEITKDFDWLVSKLINPIRVISITVKLE